MAETSSSQRPWWKASLSTWVRTKGGAAEEVSIVVAIAAIAAIGALCVRLGELADPRSPVRCPLKVVRLRLARASRIRFVSADRVVGK